MREKPYRGTPYRGCLNCGRVSYKIEKKGKYKNNNYVVIAHEMGHRCGYVKIPSRHLLYKKSYLDPLSAIGKDKRVFKNKKVGKRSPIDLLFGFGSDPQIGLIFDVHGGITFSGKSYWGDNGWWFGFDCGHAGDRRDESIMSGEDQRVFRKINTPIDGETIKTQQYVEDECKRLIDQLLKLR